MTRQRDEGWPAACERPRGSMGSGASQAAPGFAALGFGGSDVGSGIGGEQSLWH